MKFLMKWFYKNDAGKEFLTSANNSDFDTRMAMKEWVEEEVRLRLSSPDFFIYRVEIYKDSSTQYEAAYYPDRQTWSLLTSALPEDILDKLREST